ncbi:MAG: hypothetical protein M1305_07195 [Candidatus Marsarchaeota archaeon]|nr:hypothetical protein [Candidatus Marsarchaeota archaeon]
MRLVFGVAYPSQIGEEVAELGIFEETRSEARAERIGFGYRGGEVVEDETLRDTTKSLPGCLQALDDILQALLEERPDKHVARVDEDDDQSPNEAFTAALEVRDVA